MKYLVASFLMVVSNFSYACFVNGEAQRVASEFVQAPAARELIVQHGYDLPE